MKKKLRDWRICFILLFIPIVYMIYSCSRPTSIEQETEPAINAGAVYSLISEDDQGPILEIDGDYFVGWFRVGQNDEYFSEMVDSTAYFSDIWIGGKTSILAINDGDTWTASIELPDGTTSQWADVVYHAILGDEEDCFVFPYPYWKVCGTKSINVLFYRSGRCEPTGVWQMSFYKGDVEYYTGTFKTLPQLEPGSVACDSVYNQGSYPTDSYDSICYMTQFPDSIYKCDGRVGEVAYTIQRKGCALISGAIVLDYHGVTVSPVDLNAWLVANGGYSKDGGLFFPKIAEYARKAHGVNVQYDRNLRNCSWAELEQLICNFGPQVLRVYPHHYVVTDGLDENKTTFLLSDPDGGRRTTLAAEYNNKYYAVRSFSGPDYYVYPSMLMVIVHSPAELLMTDPDDNMTGVDPITGESFEDIPNSCYGVEGLYDTETGTGDPEWCELEIMQPEEGEYHLRVTGTGEGTYVLEMLGYNDADESFSFLSDEIYIYEDAVHEYAIQYSSDAGSTFKIEGGYDGDSQRKWDVNQLLSYFTIASKNIRLPSGISQFALGITYNEDIDPSSLFVELNDADITDLFNPVSDSSEIVTIDLLQGSNSLVLTIQGDVPAKKNIDTDKFEIIATP